MASPALASLTDHASTLARAPVTAHARALADDGSGTEDGAAPESVPPLRLVTRPGRVVELQR